MTLEAAGTIASWLNAAFPNEALNEAATAVFVNDVALLADARIGGIAARQIARASNKFPTIHEFRQVYRAVNEREQAEAQRKIKGLPEPRHQIPEWVLVWDYARATGETRWLPQQIDHADKSRQVMSQTDYDVLRLAWIAAGKPVHRRAIEQLVSLPTL